MPHFRCIVSLLLLSKANQRMECTLLGHLWKKTFRFFHLLFSFSGNLCSKRVAEMKILKVGLPKPPPPPVVKKRINLWFYHFAFFNQTPMITYVDFTTNNLASPVCLWICFLFYKLISGLLDLWTISLCSTQCTNIYLSIYSTKLNSGMKR